MNKVRRKKLGKAYPYPEICKTWWLKGGKTWSVYRSGRGWEEDLLTEIRDAINGLTAKVEEFRRDIKER